MNGVRFGRRFAFVDLSKAGARYDLTEIGTAPMTIWSPPRAGRSRGPSDPTALAIGVLAGLTVLGVVAVLFVTLVSAAVIGQVAAVAIGTIGTVLTAAFTAITVVSRQRRLTPTTDVRHRNRGPEQSRRRSRPPDR